jgi:hypothetical protein
MAVAQAAPSSPKPAATPAQQATAASSASAAPPSLQQQRLLDEADQLLDLARKLQAEVDKTNQYTLSINTLRRAGDIEKLAKNLQKQIEREDR